jgi:hypothetical protein
MRHRQIFTVGATAVAVAAITLGPAVTQATKPAAEAPAAALASCSGESCRGKDPVEQGCNGDQTVQIAAFAIPNEPRPSDVTLFYSPTCDAAWGHYYTNDPDENRWITLQALPPYGTAPGPNDEFVTQTWGVADYDTKMVPWGNSVRICASPGANGNDQCSGWR